MAAPFTLDAAQIVALFMESVFYGIFLITFFSCLRILLWREGGFRPAQHVNFKMLVSSLFMFVFGTLDVSFHLHHTLHAFIYSGGDPIVEFSNISSWISVMKMVCFVVQTFVGDSILLLRCWVIYNKKYRVIVVPGMLWLGCTACGIMTVVKEATLDLSEDLLNSKVIEPWITSMLCLTLVTNVITTALMVYRIYNIQKHIKHRSAYKTNSSLSNVMIILIESGLMYTLTVIILFVLYMASHNGQYGVSNSVVQIIGITFNLIITSVDRGEATQPSEANSTNGAINTVPLHLINIQTTVTRFPDESNSIKPPETNIQLRNTSEADSPYKSPVSDIENHTEWKNHQAD